MKKAFISQFSSKIKDVIQLNIENGCYNYQLQKWVGTPICDLPDTKTKTEAILTRDEEGDWN